MNNKEDKNIFKDKNGRVYIKESYFVGGKMKFHRIYVIDGIPADKFYEENASDLDFFVNGDFELIKGEKKSNNYSNEQNKHDDLPDSIEDLPF